MFLPTLSTLLLALSTSTLAFPTSAENGKEFRSSVYESLAHPPKGWERDDSVVFDKEAAGVKLRIHLVQRNMGAFHELALQVGDAFIYLIFLGWI